MPFVELKKNFAKWQKELYGCGWNSLFWNNHDLPRIVSRWGNDKEYRKESAKMLATVLHGMQGTPYIYQGEELGMTNVRFPDITHYRDIETLHMYEERLEAGYKKEEILRSVYAKGRDNARTPMQWDDSKNGGFTDGTPWIEVNPNYLEINAKKEISDADSIYNYYKKLIKLRKENMVFTQGEFQLLLEEDPQIFAYTRTTGEEMMCVIANFTDKPAPCRLPETWQKKELLIHNYNTENIGGVLRPYEAMIYIDR